MARRLEASGLQAHVPELAGHPAVQDHRHVGQRRRRPRGHRAALGAAPAPRLRQTGPRPSKPRAKPPALLRAAPRPARQASPPRAAAALRAALPLPLSLSCRRPPTCCSARSSRPLPALPPTSHPCPPLVPSQHMLVYEPAKRISAKQALRHPYFDDLDKSQYS